MARVLLELKWAGARGHTLVRSWHTQNAQRIEGLLLPDNSHLMVAEKLVQEEVGHMLDVVEVVPHRFASPRADLELPEVDCKGVEDFFEPSGEHTLVLVLVARAQPALFPVLSPTCLVLVPGLAHLSPFPSVSTSLFPAPAPSPSLASPYHSHIEASPRMQPCRKSLSGLLGEQGRPSDCHQIYSHCALVAEYYRIFEVEEGH